MVQREPGRGAIMSQPVRQVSVEEIGSAVVIRIHARLADEATVQQLLQTVAAIPAMQPGKTVVLDLGGVEYLPTLCLGALVEVQKRCQQQSHKLKLAALRPPIRRLLSVTNLEMTFEICESVDEAVR
jgi:anti-anti-sigma factor